MDIQKVMDDAKQVDMGDCYRLFLDLSSTCTGYVIAKMEARKCIISRLGVMWFGANMENGEKYFRLQQAITCEFYVINAITDVIYESFHVNPKQVGNSLVVPEMIGAVKACLYDVSSMPLGVEDMSPTAWRGQIGLKPIKTPKLDGKGNQEKTKRGQPRFNNDFKVPIVNYMDKMFDNQIPKTIKSNVTGNVRATPSDLYDALGLCVGWHKKFNCDEFVIAENALDGHPEGGHAAI